MKHKTKEQYLQSLSPERFMINNLLDTIAQAYIDGIEEAEKKFRDAIIVAMEKQGIKVTPFYNIILNEISK